MKLATLTLLFVFATAVVKPANDVQHVTLNQEFEVKVGQQVLVENAGLRINFQVVAEDSRCPVNVKCVWTGNAKIVLRLSKAGKRNATINLNTGLDPKHLSYQGYDIKLVKVMPQRKDGVTINSGDYAVTLLVTKM
jgi:hypothetical protein